MKKQQNVVTVAEVSSLPYGAHDVCRNWQLRDQVEKRLLALGGSQTTNFCYRTTRLGRIVLRFDFGSGYTSLEVNRKPQSVEGFVALYNRIW